MEIAVLWITLLIATWIVADRRGRSVIGWVIIGMLLSPIISLILVLVLPSKRQAALPPQIVNVIHVNQQPAPTPEVIIPSTIPQITKHPQD